jgi:hypothetical protein
VAEDAVAIVDGGAERAGIVEIAAVIAALQGARQRRQAILGRGVALDTARQRCVSCCSAVRASASLMPTCRAIWLTAPLFRESRSTSSRAMDSSLPDLWKTRGSLKRASELEE